MAEIDVRQGRPFAVDSIRYGDFEVLLENAASGKIRISVAGPPAGNLDVCNATVSGVDDLIRALQVAKRVFNLP